MGDALAERAFLRRQLIEVHVEVVARDATKGDDVGLADGAPMRQQRVADLQILEVLAERMQVRLAQRCTPNMLAGDRREHRRRALHRRALQVMLDRAQSAQFFPTAGATRTAVLEHRQRRAMASRLGRGDAVEHEQASVQRGDTRNHTGRGRRILRHQCSNQAAAATCRQRQGFIETVVGHQGADWAEGLDIVDRVVMQGVAAEQQRRREERAFGHAVALRREAVALAIHELSALHQRRNALGHVGALRVRRERAHANVLARGVANDGLRQPRAQPRRDRIDLRSRHDRAADRGALLARLHRHLARDFLDEEIELFVVGRHVGREDRAVQRVGLGVEWDRVAHDVRMH